MAARWDEGYRNNPHFHRAIRKYGWDGFEHEIIAENLSKKEAEEIERIYIALYDSTNAEKGYNIALGGNSIGKHSEETKRKISESQKGRKFTEEHKKRLSVAHKGQKISDEQRAKISAGLKGNKNTLGFRHSNETKKKMSQNRKGKHGKRVICLPDGKVFESVLEAAGFYGLTRHQIMNYCNGKTEHLLHCELTFAYL
jgi:group I intron endonuclease